MLKDIESHNTIELCGPELIGECPDIHRYVPCVAKRVIHRPGKEVNTYRGGDAGDHPDEGRLVAAPYVEHTLAPREPLSDEVPAAVVPGE
jgi:hypothetical protein